MQSYPLTHALETTLTTINLQEEKLISEHNRSNSDTTRTKNKYDPKLDKKSEITSLVQQKTYIWRQHLNKQWDHEQNTHGEKQP